MELFREMDCGEEGLTAAQAAERLKRYGSNELQTGARKSTMRIFLEQFADFLVIILIWQRRCPPCWGMWRACSSFWRSLP